MKIRIIRTCAVNGQHAEAGSIMVVGEDLARTLIAHRRAERFGEVVDTRESTRPESEPTKSKKGKNAA